MNEELSHLFIKVNVDLDERIRAIEETNEKFDKLLHYLRGLRLDKTTKKSEDSSNHSSIPSQASEAKVKEQNDSNTNSTNNDKLTKVLSKAKQLRETTASSSKAQSKRTIPSSTVSNKSTESTSTKHTPSAIIQSPRQSNNSNNKNTAQVDLVNDIQIKRDKFIARLDRLSQMKDLHPVPAMLRHNSDPSRMDLTSPSISHQRTIRPSLFFYIIHLSNHTIQIKFHQFLSHTHKHTLNTYTLNTYTPPSCTPDPSDVYRSRITDLLTHLTQQCETVRNIRLYKKTLDTYTQQDILLLFQLWYKFQVILYIQHYLLLSPPQLQSHPSDTHTHNNKQYTYTIPSLYHAICLPYMQPFHFRSNIMRNQEVFTHHITSKEWGFDMNNKMGQNYDLYSNLIQYSIESVIGRIYLPAVLNGLRTLSAMCNTPNNQQPSPHTAQHLLVHSSNSKVNNTSTLASTSKLPVNDVIDCEYDASGNVTNERKAQWREALRVYRDVYNCLVYSGQRPRCCMFFDKDDL